MIIKYTVYIYNTNVRMNNNILKTPLLIEAKSLTDTAGKKDVSNDNDQVQLILQIISKKIVVTTVRKQLDGHLLDSMTSVFLVEGPRAMRVLRWQCALGFLLISQ